MKENGRLRWSVCSGVIVVMALAGAVRAANVEGAWANGATVVTGVCLSTTATISDVNSQSPLPVTTSDDAVFVFNVSWDDQRSASSSDAVHSFHISAQWAETERADAWHNVTTTGAQSGSTTISVSVHADAEYVIVIDWDVTLTVSPCTITPKSETRTVVLDLP